MTNSEATTLLNLSDISLYLSKNELEQKKFFLWIDETQRCRIMYMVKKSLKWAKPYYVGTSSFNSVANYLGGIIGKWKGQAQTVLNLGNVGSIVNIVTGDSSSIAAFNLQIVVGGGTLSSGDTTYVINYPYILKDSISVELPQSNLPIADSTQFSYQVSYTSNNATITFLNGTPNIGVQTGMELLIKGLRFVQANASGSFTNAGKNAWSFQTVSTTGTTLSVPSLATKTIIVIFRATPLEVITVGTPTSNQILWDSNAALLTTSSSNPLIQGETLAIQYNL